MALIVCNYLLSGIFYCNHFFDGGKKCCKTGALMKELGNKLKALRGRLSIEQAASATGRSRETIRKLETGLNISLKSLKKIAKGYKAEPEDEDDLVCTWLRGHAGDHAKRLRIEPLSAKRSRLADVARDKTSAMIEAFSGLTTKEQDALLLAAQRPEVLRSVRHLHQLYDAARSRNQNNSD